MEIKNTKDLLIKFQEYQLEFDIQNHNFAHNGVAITFLNKYDIGDYIPKQSQHEMINTIIKKRENELETWQNVIGKNASFYTLDDKIKASQFIGVLSSILTDLKKLKELYV